MNPVSLRSFRTIGELAERCGNYCWAESQLFTRTGTWAGGDGDAGVRLFCSTVSRQHGLLAAQWRDRLPVRAGVDRAALMVPPSGGLVGSFELLDAEPDLVVRLAGLLGVLLPRLLDSYRDDLARAAPVREAAVAAVLRQALTVGAAEEAGGRRVLDRCQKGVQRGERVTEFVSSLQESFSGPRGIFPDDWAS